MRNAHARYACYPSVLPIGVPTEVRIFPRDISHRFREDRTYELCVFGEWDDQLEYISPLAFDHPVRVCDGCLCFTHVFDAEQSYSVRFRENTETETLTVYAVEEDLYALRPLKGDLHTHSWYSDGQDGIPVTPADYREEGFDFFALTDHNRMFPSVMAQKLYRDVELGMHIMRGEEVHTPGSSLHIVHVGGKKSVCERYIGNPDAFEAEVSRVEETLSHLPEQYRRRAALARWACDAIHDAEGLAIFAHPCWKPRAHNVDDRFCDILFDEKTFDAFELLNGMLCRYNNMQVALWQRQQLRGNDLPVVGSSDSHRHDSSTGNFARRFTYVFAEKNDTESILSAIRKGYCVAAETTKNDETEVRFYGSLRLVRFAHFLFENYFNETWRFCVAEGVLMRRYAQGDTSVADLLSSLSGTVEQFWSLFYGKSGPVALSEERASYLDECLDLQRRLGPPTKGSLIYVYAKNGNRE